MKELGFQEEVKGKSHLHHMRAQVEADKLTNLPEPQFTFQENGDGRLFAS